MRSLPCHPIFVTAIAFSKGAVFTKKREVEPYRGFHALPESLVKRGETLERAAHRTLLEASGLSATKLKLVSVFDDVDTGEMRVRNRRSFIISFVALDWTGEIPLEGCRWVADWRNEQLAWENNLALIEADEVIRMASKSRLLYALR